MNHSSLHIINRPMTIKGLTAQMNLFQPNDGVLFIQDGCYNLKSASFLAELTTGKINGYGLAEDLKARGINTQAIALVDYPEFVDLSLKYHKTISW